MSATAANGVVDAATRLHFIQRGTRVVARYAGGSVRRGWLAGTLVGSTLVFRYLQREGSDELHGGHSTCTVDRLGDGRVRVTEQFTWATRVGSGVNVFVEIAG